MGPTLVFRSTYGRVLTVATGVVAVALGVSTALTGDVGAVVGALVPAALVTYLVWMLFWRPAVEVSDGGVEVRNVTRTVHVPWTAYEGVDTRYSLEVRYAGGRVTAWSAPRSSGTARWLRSSRRRAVGQEQVVTGASAEAVADAVTQRHAMLTAAGHLDRAVQGAPGPPPRRPPGPPPVLGARAAGPALPHTPSPGRAAPPERSTTSRAGGDDGGHQLAPASPVALGAVAAVGRATRFARAILRSEGMRF